MSDYVKLLTNSSIIVNRAAFLLDQENIPTRIKDWVESARLAGFGTPQNAVELHVPQSEFEKAQKILKESDLAEDVNS